MPLYSLITPKKLANVHFAAESEWNAVRTGSSKQGDGDVAAAMQAELKLVANSVRQVHDQLKEQNQRQQDLLADVRTAVVELAMAVATEVLQETTVDEQRVQTLVAETLELLPKEQPASVFMNPSDVGLLDEMELERHIGRQLLEVGSDATLPRGSCRVEGPHYGYVSHWKMHLANIRRRLLDQLDD